MKRIFVSFLVASAALTPALAETMATLPSAAPAPKRLEYLNPADFEPVRLLQAPPAKGSPAEARELASLHALIASASAERIVQAKWDADHEDPSIFNDAIGRDLTKLPHTWALLSIIDREAGIAAGLSKAYFNRMRPWGVDGTIPNCEGPSNKAPFKSYPSGHSTLGYAVGYALAQLAPAKAAAVLSKAEDYALSREYCGVHFATDTAASQVVGTVAAVRLLGDPRLAAEVAASRAELSSN